MRVLLRFCCIVGFSSPQRSQKIKSSRDPRGNHHERMPYRLSYCLASVCHTSTFFFLSSVRPIPRELKVACRSSLL
jgi:hypothetical protein